MAPKAKILIIDDDPEFVEAIMNLLTAQNYEAVSAKNSSEGREKVRLESPDLILLDLMMESHDAGFLLAKDLKADPVYKKIPVLMLTAVGTVTGYKFSMEQDGYWMKTDDFIEKPVTPEVLLGRIEKALGK